MAIVKGCIHALPSLGGAPRQCTDPIARTVKVRATDKPTREDMGLCQRHADMLSERRTGTIYREVNGTPTPVLVTLDQLR